MAFLTHRRRQSEWMDEEGVDPGELRAALEFIRRINSLLGYTRATLSHLKRFSRSWKKGERIEILDLATGSADIPRAILKWAAQAGHDVHIVGVDRHPVTVRQAEEGEPNARLKIVQGDVFDLPFQAGSFDYVLTAMFLHHLEDHEVVEVLRTMGRLARRGVIVADLLRHYRAYAWVCLFTAFSTPMVRHDARVNLLPHWWPRVLRVGEHPEQHSRVVLSLGVAVGVRLLDLCHLAAEHQGHHLPCSAT